jgi:cell division protein FtsB
MLSFHEKKRIKLFLLSKLVLLALAALTVLLSMATWDVYQKFSETAVKREQRETALAELKVREAALRSELARLETTQGLEANIRSKFDVAREGEGVIIVVDPKAENQQASVAEKQGWLGRFLGLFKRD